MRDPIPCEICGGRIDPLIELRYARAAPGAASVIVRDVPQCSECRRHGCPACLRVVEERADDFFFDEFLCHGCLEKCTPRSA